MKKSFHKMASSASAFCVAFLAMAMGSGSVFAQDGMMAATPEAKEPIKLRAFGKVRERGYMDYSSINKGDNYGAMYVRHDAHLGMSFAYKGFETLVSFENANTWGYLKGQLKDDVNVSVLNAWGDVELAKGLNVRVGRQDILLDYWMWDNSPYDALNLRFQHEGFIIGTYAMVNAKKSPELSQQFPGTKYAAIAHLGYQVNDMFGLNGYYFADMTQNKTKVNELFTRSTIKAGLKVKLPNLLTGYLDGYYQLGKTATLGEKVSIGAYSLKTGWKLQLHENISLNATFYMLSGNSKDTKQDQSSNVFTRVDGCVGLEGIAYFSDDKIGGKGLFTENIGLGFAHKGFTAGVNVWFSQMGVKYDKEDRNYGTELDIDLGYKIKEWVTLGAWAYTYFATDAFAKQMSAANPKDYNKMPYKVGLSLTFLPSYTWTIDR